MVTAAVDPRTVAAAVTDPELPLLTLDDLGVLGDVTVDGETVVVALMPTYTGCPAMDVMRDDVVAALRPGGLRRRRRPGAAGAGVELGPDQRGGAAQAGRRRDRPARRRLRPRRRPGARSRSRCARRRRAVPLPALRIHRHRGDVAVRRDGVQVAAPLPVRAASRSSTSRRCDGMTSRSTFHPLAVADVAELCDDAVAITFDVPAELADEFAFRPGQSVTVRRTVDGVEQRRSYSICAPAGAPPRIGVREVPDGAVSTWLVRGVRPGDRIEVQRPSGTFTPDVDRAAHHVLIVAGSGITPALSIVSSVLANPGCRVTRALRQPAHGHGDVRRRARRPQGSGAHAGSSWSTCCRGSRASPSCSAAASTPPSCACSCRRW